MSLWVVGETVTLSYPSPPGVVAAVIAVHLEGAFVYFEVAGDGEPGVAMVNCVDHLCEIVVMLSPYDKRDAVIVGVGGANIDENGHAVGIFRLYMSTTGPATVQVSPIWSPALYQRWDCGISRRSAMASGVDSSSRRISSS